MQFHRGGLGDEVVGHLVIGKPPERIPEEHGAGLETTANFIHPDVVKGHPFRFIRPEMAWFDVFPKIIRS